MKSHGEFNVSFFDRICAVDKLWHDLCQILPTTFDPDFVYYTNEARTQIYSDEHDAIERLANVFDGLYGVGTVTSGFDSRSTRSYYCTNQ